MKKNTVRILSLVGLLALITGVLVLLEAIVWNKMTITYQAALVLQEENGTILSEEELPPSLLVGGGTQYLSLGGETQKVSVRDGYGYSFLRWSDGSTDKERRDRTFENKTLTAYYTYDTGKLAHFSYAGGSLTVRDLENQVSTLEGKLVKVADKKGYSAYKSTYTLSFAEEQTLLGMTGKEWLFAPIYEDPTLLRDYFSYRFASFMAEQPQGELVLLLNEKEYAGVYLLSPKFLPTGTTAIEYGVEDDLSYETLDTSEYGLEVIQGAKYDLPDHTVKLHKTQVEYIKIKALLNAYSYVFNYNNEQAIRDRIDIPSAVDAYIVTELTKNTMAGRRGTFLTYRNGKFTFLSETYFSLSGGLDVRYPSAEGSVFDYTKDELGRVNGDPIYLLCGLARHTWFLDLVKERWQEIGGISFTRAYEQVRILYNRAGKLLADDKAIYPCYSSSNELRVEEWAYYTSEVKKNTFDRNVDTYFAWLSQRKGYMDRTYGGS